jgi:hypothetical protein
MGKLGKRLERLHHGAMNANTVSRSRVILNRELGVATGGSIPMGVSHIGIVQRNTLHPPVFLELKHTPKIGNGKI